jgi:hypothetical protein
MIDRPHPLPWRCLQRGALFVAAIAGHEARLEERPGEAYAVIVDGQTIAEISDDQRRRAARLAKIRAEQKIADLRLADRAAACVRSVAAKPVIGTMTRDPRAPLDGDAAIDQLADDMKSALTRTGGVTRDEMLLIGWTERQLDKFTTRARERAYASEALV